MRTVPLIILLTFGGGWCWSQDEMDIYDLVEEIGQQTTFYQLLSVTQNSTSADIRRAFRQQSLIHHPDKSSEDNAETRFRQIAGAYEVLRSDDRRALYDHYLANGMPDWRSAMFYYRRVRRIGLVEIGALLAVIVTVGQYLTAWAGYHDKRLVVEEQLRPRAKREKMSIVQLEALISETMAQFRPSWYNTLPCQLVRLAVWLITCAPWQLASWCRHHQLLRRQLLAAKQLEAAEARQQAEQLQQQQLRRREQKERRRRKRVDQLQQLEQQNGDGQPVGAGGLLLDGGSGRCDAELCDWSTERSGLWTDEDLCTLSRLVSRYPAGVPDRWRVIARALQRTVAEVSGMAQRIKERPALVPSVAAAAATAASGGDGGAETQQVLPSGKVKTRAPEPAAEACWSQVQQRALEQALVQFPKGSDRRWDRVAKLVPDKNKEECIERFRLLAERLRKKKLAQERAEEEEEEEHNEERAPAEEQEKESGTTPVQ